MSSSPRQLKIHHLPATIRTVLDSVCSLQHTRTPFLRGRRLSAATERTALAKTIEGPVPTMVVSVGGSTESVRRHLSELLRSLRATEVDLSLCHQLLDPLSYLRSIEDALLG